MWRRGARCKWCPFPCILKCITGGGLHIKFSRSFTKEYMKPTWFLLFCAVITFFSFKPILTPPKRGFRGGCSIPTSASYVTDLSCFLISIKAKLVIFSKIKKISQEKIIFFANFHEVKHISQSCRSTRPLIDADLRL